MNQSTINSTVNWIFGFFVFTLGILNVLRGNDFEFGIALILVSAIYFPPTYLLFTKWTGLSIHYILRIILALAIIWVNLAVGAINEGYYPEITG